MGEQHQIKVSVGDDYLNRIRQAEADGRITNKSGLAKVAYWHAMEHGQAATEDLLRNGKPAQSVSQEVTELLEQILTHIEHEAAERAADVKRCVVQCAAMLAGLLVLLAFGTALYLRPARTA